MSRCFRWSYTIQILIGSAWHIAVVAEALEGKDSILVTLILFSYFQRQRKYVILIYFDHLQQLDLISIENCLVLGVLWVMPLII